MEPPATRTLVHLLSGRGRGGFGAVCRYATLEEVEIRFYRSGESSD